jgi:hypothetical protein
LHFSVRQQNNLQGFINIYNAKKTVTNIIFRLLFFGGQEEFIQVEVTLRKHGMPATSAFMQAWLKCYFDEQ